MPKPVHTPARIPIGFVQIEDPVHNQLNLVSRLVQSQTTKPTSALDMIMSEFDLVNTSDDPTIRVALLRRPAREDQRPQVISFVQLSAGRRLMIQPTGTMWLKVIALEVGATFRSGSVGQFEANIKSKATDDSRLRSRRSGLGEPALWMEDSAWILESTGPVLIIFQAMKGTICPNFAPLNLPLPRRPQATPIAKATTPPAARSSLRVAPRRAGGRSSI